MQESAALPFRAAVFDMDGLLLDSEPFWMKAERDAFASAGLALSDADLCETIGMPIDEVAAHWFARRPWDIEAHPQEELVEAVVLRVIELIESRGEPLPGVHKALELLSAAGLLLAVASSSPRRIIEPSLKALGIREFFQVVHSAEQELRGKPDPAVYRSTMDLLGLTAEQCFALEDSVAGLQAAQAAGMKCILVAEPRQRDRPEMQTADLALDSLEALDREVLTRLGQPHSTPLS